MMSDKRYHSIEGKYGWESEPVPGHHSSGWIGRSERELVRFLEKEMGGLDEDGKLAIIFSSLFLKGGHTTLPLDQSPKQWAEILGLEPGVIESLPGRLLDSERLKKQHLAGSDDETAIFSISGNRLTIRKYQILENKLTQWLTKDHENNSITDISNYITILFPKSGQNEADWQMIAAAMSTFRRLLILSGGPGTGKTTTVARILVLNRVLAGRPMRIALTAPTGKAAGRMGEALHDELHRLSDILDELGLTLDQFPAEAKTVHRLLSGLDHRGILPPAQKRFLPYDLIVVDEASMMDLELISRLISHIGPETRLILMGDKDQLSSVEAGSVFADICLKKENGFSPDVIEALKRCGVNVDLKELDKHPLNDSIVYLTKSYRFDERSGIGRLAKVINSGNDEGINFHELFDRYDDLNHLPFLFEENEINKLLDQFIVRLEEASRITEPTEMFEHWKRSVWLSPLRSGLTGTERLNRLLERYIMADVRPKSFNEWYHGRPVIVTRNDYSAGVYNGDLGVCMQEEGRFWIYIESDSQVKRVRPDRIKNLEPFYFLTVHKSQGSESDEVNLLLPLKDHRLLTRELLYTAITRAKKRFYLHGSLELFETGIKRKTVRYTGVGIDLRSQIAE